MRVRTITHYLETIIQEATLNTNMTETAQITQWTSYIRSSSSADTHHKRPQFNEQTTLLLHFNYYLPLYHADILFTPISCGHVFHPSRVPHKRKRTIHVPLFSRDKTNPSHVPCVTSCTNRRQLRFYKISLGNKGII